jgi:hypothetical protein
MSGVPWTSASSSATSGGGVWTFTFDGPRPKFHNPRTPRRLLSVDPRPSTEYRPVSCWTWARTVAGGGPEAADCMGTDLLFSEIESSVSGPMRRAYNAVRTDGAGNARLAWSSVGLRPFSSCRRGSREASATGVGTLMSLYPLTRVRSGMLVDREGICPRGVVE